jgi:predicted nucleic acid-binding protein
VTPPYLYDAGALIALDRNVRSAIVRHDEALNSKRRILVPSVIVTQVWRDPRRQHALGRFLQACKIVTIDNELARAGGILCARVRSSDAVDAIVVATGQLHGPCIAWTSDPKDLEALNAVAVDPRQVKILTV